MRWELSTYIFSCMSSSAESESKGWRNSFKARLSRRMYSEKSLVNGTFDWEARIVPTGFVLMNVPFCMAR